MPVKKESYQLGIQRLGSNVFVRHTIAWSEAEQMFHCDTCDSMDLKYRAPETRVMTNLHNEMSRYKSIFRNPNVRSPEGAPLGTSYGAVADINVRHIIVPSSRQAESETPSQIQRHSQEKSKKMLTLVYSCKQCRDNGETSVWPRNAGGLNALDEHHHKLADILQEGGNFVDYEAYTGTAAEIGHGHGQRHFGRRFRFDAFFPIIRSKLVRVLR